MRALGASVAAALLTGTGCGDERASGAPVAPGPGMRAARERAAPAEREWRSYLGGQDVAHASPLAQIHRGNVAQLELAWRYDAGIARGARGSEIQCNPLVVKGVLYGSSAALRLFALDAATGEELWSFSPDPGDTSLPRASRGLVYWEEGDDERILFGAGPWLYALDARTGRPMREFGRGGRVDLRDGLPERARNAWVSASTPGALYRDLLIVGTRVSEFRDAAPGWVRAYDVRSGEIRWTFRTIPRPGEPGADTWPNDASERIGGANAWAGISVDVQRGLAFVPTGSATFDFHGADRSGDNLFANSLIALDAATGERRWHYQVVRHDVWDRDLPAPPNLVELQRGGRRVAAVAQVTKSGHVFVFDRETGEPVFPIEEVAVPRDGLPGEQLAPSQPLPLAPPPFARQHFEPTDRTPDARAAVLARLQTLRRGAFAPPSEQGTLLQPGTDGGAEWGGAAWDAHTGLLYVNANDVPTLLRMTRVPADYDPVSPRGGYLMLCSGCHGVDLRGDGASVPSLRGALGRLGPLGAYRVVRDGAGRMSGFGEMMRWYEIGAVLWHVANAEDTDALGDSGEEGAVFVNAGYQQFTDPDGFPASAPPWGTLTALDLNRGELAWQIPLGDFPRTLASGRSGLGAENYGGPVVTAGGLLFIAATPDERIRAFDKRTGALLWEAELPASGFATPATYEADGRQFVVIAAGGGKLGRPPGGQYLAFALPR